MKLCVIRVDKGELVICIFKKHSICHIKGHRTRQELMTFMVICQSQTIFRFAGCTGPQQFTTCAISSDEWTECTAAKPADDIDRSEAS